MTSARTQKLSASIGFLYVFNALVSIVGSGEQNVGNTGLRTSGYTSIFRLASQTKRDMAQTETQSVLFSLSDYTSTQNILVFVATSIFYLS